MGGNISKNKGRGDVDERLNQYTSPLGDSLGDTPKQSVNGRRYSNDRALHARWEQYIEGAVSTPSHDKKKTANQEGSCKDDGLQSQSSPTPIKPSNRGDEVLSASPTLPIANLLPPKIRLQILSPVHSRAQLRHPPGLSTHDVRNNVPAQIQEQFYAPKEKRSVDPGVLFLKPPSNKCPEESCQEIATQNSQPLQQSLYEKQLRKRPASQRKIKNQLTIQPTQALSPHSQQQLPPKLRAKISKENKAIKPVGHEPQTPEQAGTVRPGTRTLSNSSAVKAENVKKIGRATKLLRRTSSHRLTESRQTTALSGSSSKKLKVKGLQNFVNTHKPCPPLWAKQFPCRSRFHPDNYLYDFEGFNAPKRPVAEMEKCSKKCGRCNRCGVYADSVCQKCGNCKIDCKCPIMTSLPTAEHFLSQIFGPDWTQTQKVEVNGHPVIPDKPRLNLHDASSNNPLKVSTNSPSEEPKKVVASGYDTYTPVPSQPPAGVPSYPPYPGFGYGYPTYPHWPGSYPPSYYPAYAPMPPPPPYYGYSQPPVIPPAYGYAAGPNKTDMNC
jgi:hypothetical protein